ncbi:hypothetical protein [Caballeronia sp. LZ034LL]|uniref:hypothetical protein n=1 Tax=Caballeronia sp. LZ034LL TaxID=3038567 RepID=UPI00286049A8|nr:hypothetical protein [Caballeronia sp. LZ034LL]MDR5839323.1 hypothetical protein [Caballeronia sp. LZ034LL]
MLTLTQIASAVVQGAVAVESAITAVGVVVSDVKKIVSYIPDLMQTFENAYAQIGDSANGAGKLAGVLAALEAVAVKIGVTWTANVKALIADIIAQAKAAYNAVTSMGTSSNAAA